MSDTDSDIGQRLGTLRGDISQAGLAAEMAKRGHKWSQATVWAVESGKRPIRLAEALDVASICGFGIQALVKRDPLGERLSEVPATIAAASHAAKQFRSACEYLLGTRFTLQQQMEHITDEFGVPETPALRSEYESLRRQMENVSKPSAVEIAQEMTDELEGALRGLDI